MMSIATLIFVLVIRNLFFMRLELRLNDSLEQEIEKFRRFTNKQLEDKRQPLDNVNELFDLYFVDDISDRHQYKLSFINEKLYKASPAILPDNLKYHSNLIDYWAQLDKPEHGEKLFTDSSLIYLAEPVKIVGEKLESEGVFVVVYSTESAYRWVDETISTVVSVAVIVLILTLLIAWLIAGLILTPLSSLTKVAKSINELDFGQRIPLKGTYEVVELTIAFNEMLERLQKSFISQRNFISDVGHEIQTPITIARGHLQLISADPIDVYETIKLITEELDRLSRFVDDLLLLAKAEQPDFLLLEIVDVSSFTEKLFAKFKALASRDWKLENKGTGRILADSQRLTQAVLNLVRNAVEYTTEKNTIVFGSKLTDKHLFLWVHDTGQGIAYRDQQRIFKRFERGSCTSQLADGSGLGLSIVDIITKAHGGQIELSSELNVGSKFTIVIPIDIS